MGITECRVMQNLPGPGWYWEVIAESTTVVARGLAGTRAEAETQATEAEQATLESSSKNTSSA